VYEQSNGLNDVLKKTFAVLYSYMIHEMNTPLPGRGALHNHATQRDATRRSTVDSRAEPPGSEERPGASPSPPFTIRLSRNEDRSTYISSLCVPAHAAAVVGWIGSDRSNRTLPVPFRVVPDAAQQSTASQSVFQYSTVAATKSLSPIPTHDVSPEWRSVGRSIAPTALPLFDSTLGRSPPQPFFPHLITRYPVTPIQSQSSLLS